MPQQTKIFRVFISSTFSDMKQVRGILQLDAFLTGKVLRRKRSQISVLRSEINEEYAL